MTCTERHNFHLICLTTKKNKKIVKNTKTSYDVIASICVFPLYILHYFTNLYVYLVLITKKHGLISLVTSDDDDDDEDDSKQI